MSIKKKTILALGADIKNRILLARGKSLHFGRDLGDLSESGNFEQFTKEVRRFTRGLRPDIVACDLHPNYFSSVFARDLQLKLKTFNLQLIQHHHAHIASVIQEHNLHRPVIGVSFDGTGYGQDGNSWGGEFFLVSKSGFERLGYLEYQMMPGGDKVVRQPWRMALSILGPRCVHLLRGVSKKDIQLVVEMLSKNINSPLTSSAGRLFDAAAALAGICLYASYEAEGPIKLQALCDAGIKQRYEFDVVRQNGHSVISTKQIFVEMIKDLNQGRSKNLIATKFHNTMAEIIVRVAKRLSRSLGIKDAALSGGVFQNSFLKTMVVNKLHSLGFRVFTNERAPANDLNISLGQYHVSGSTGKS